MRVFKMILLPAVLAGSLAIVPPPLCAQGTEFTYQGSLQNGGTAANGNYDFEFRLFDAAAAGSQIGPTASRVNIAVNSGTFGTTLDFGASSFPGLERWIEVSVRPAGGGGFQQMLPRTKMASSPYAIQSLNAGTATNAATATNATQLGGVAANQYVTTATGNTSYIRNSATQQAGASLWISGPGFFGGAGSFGGNLNVTGTLGVVANTQINGNLTVGGTGTANILTAGTQFNIGGDRVLSAAGTNNIIVGKNAGTTNTGGSNSFFGVGAGENNTSGGNNSFFGVAAGRFNSGTNNSFFGLGAGLENAGNNNTFLGFSAGSNNATGSKNTAIGFNANIGVFMSDLTYATAIGADAVVTTSNTIVVGRSQGEDTVRVPGNLVQESGGLVVLNSPVRFVTLGSAGATALCRNAGDFIATCSSSLRYKSNINRFSSGLDLVKRLKPITFDWKDGGMHDLGLGAEDVAAIEPLLVTYNAKGEVEGIKYDRIGVVLVNAVKEQQAQIEKLVEQNGMQQSLIERLITSLCKQNAGDALCKELK